jgi:hypothetical protein
VLAVGSLEHAGSLRLELAPTLRPLEPRRARHFTVTLRVSAPGARTVATRRVTVPLTLRTPPPVPTPLGVRARRSGDDLIVSWHTAFPARRVTFAAFAYGRTSGRPAYADVKGRGRTRFRIRLRGARAATAVYVTASGGVGTHEKRAHVKLRG